MRHWKKSYDTIRHWEYDTIRHWKNLYDTIRHFSSMIQYVWCNVHFQWKYQILRYCIGCILSTLEQVPGVPEIALADSKRWTAVPGLSLMQIYLIIVTIETPRFLGLPTEWTLGSICRIASIWHLVFFALAYPEAILFTKLPNICSYIRCTFCSRLLNNKYYAACIVKEIF